VRLLPPSSALFRPRTRLCKTIPHRPGVARATRIRASRAARPAPPRRRPLARRAFRCGRCNGFLPDKARDKLAAREHDFLTSDLSHRALQARGMGLSTPDFMRQCLRQEWARFFEHIDVVLCSPAPTGPIRHDQKPDPHARSIEVNGNQRPYFELMRGLVSLLAPVCRPPRLRRCLARMACRGASRSSPRASRIARPSAAPRCSTHLAQVLALPMA
jgi:hypothetical protein